MKSNVEHINAFLRRLEMSNKVSKGDVIRFENDIGFDMITSDINLESFTTIPTTMNVDMLKNHLITCKMQTRVGSRAPARLMACAELSEAIKDAIEKYKIFNPREKEYVGYTDVVKVIKEDKSEESGIRTSEFKSFSTLTLAEFAELGDSLLATLNRQGLDETYKVYSSDLTYIGLSSLVIVGVTQSRLLIDNLVYFREDGKSEDYDAIIPENLKDKDKFVYKLAGYSNKYPGQLWESVGIINHVKTTEWGENDGEIYILSLEDKYRKLSDAVYVRDNMTVDDILDLICLTVTTYKAIKNLGSRLKITEHMMQNAPYSFFVDEPVWMNTCYEARRFMNAFLRSMESFKKYSSNGSSNKRDDDDDDDDD